MELEERLIEAAQFAHRLTGYSVDNHFVMRAAVEIRRLRNQVETAKKIVDAGVDLMTLEQISKWDGVRSFLEQETIDYAPVDLLANAVVSGRPRDAADNNGR